MTDILIRTRRSERHRNVTGRHWRSQGSALTLSGKRCRRGFQLWNPLHNLPHVLMPDI